MATEPVSADAVAAARAVLELVDRARAGAHRSTRPEVAMAKPVLVLAGGTDQDGESLVSSYRDALLTGLAELAGTLVSGATTVGVAALAGDVRERLGPRVRAIGYAPVEMPAGVQIETDPNRIDEIRRTRTSGFGVAEPISYWTDILAAGIPPERVGVIGIGGGPISMVEYLLATAIGARVGAVTGSGRAADQFLRERAPRVGAAHGIAGDADGFRAFVRRLGGPDA